MDSRVWHTYDNAHNNSYRHKDSVADNHADRHIHKHGDTHFYKDKYSHCAYINTYCNRHLYACPCYLNFYKYSYRDDNKNLDPDLYKDRIADANKDSQPDLYDNPVNKPDLDTGVWYAYNNPDRDSYRYGDCHGNCHTYTDNGAEPY